MESITIVADTDIHIVSVGAQGPAGPAGPPGAAVNIDDTTPSTSTTFSSEHILGLIPEVSLSGEATAVAGVVTLSNDAVTGKVLTGFTSGAGVVSPTDSILQAIEKLDGNAGGKVSASEKDAFGGHAGLTAFRLNLKNATGTVLSWLTSTATAARIWTMPDKDGTVAMLSDLAGAETTATIKAKLGITVLSGDNTGDQVIPTTLPASDVSAWAKSATKPEYTAAEVGAQVAGTYAAGTGTANGTNTGDETGATIRSKLGVTTLSGSNTGDQVIPTTLPASDVSAWAKAASKPAYTAAEVGAQVAGTYASGTGSASGTNTGDNATNTQYSGLVSNATHTGDVTGSTVLSVVGINGTFLGGLGTGILKIAGGGPMLAANSDLPAMSATVGGAVPTPPNNTTTFLRGDGTFAAPASSSTMTATVGGLVPTPPNNTTSYLRGDGTFATPAGGGDMTLAGVQAVTGAKTYADTKLLMNNAAGTIASSFTNTNTAARTYTLKDASGTIAFVSDITGTNSGTNTGDETTATIKTKLGITTLSGSNTGDQTLPTTMTSSDGGLVPTPPNNTTTFLRGDGTFATPAAGGAAIAVLDEGTSLTTALSSINFTGAGVTATNVGSAVTVAIAAGGGGGSPFATDIVANGVVLGLGGGSVAFNTAVGASALAANTTGSTNTALGATSLVNNTTGYQNTGVGAMALPNNATGYGNTAVGVSALHESDAATGNTAIGASALMASTTGENNTAVGAYALWPTTTGSNNTAIGRGATAADAADSNTILIGAAAAGLGDNSTVIGNSSTTRTRIYGALENGNGAAIGGGGQMLGNALVKGISFNAQVIAEDILIPANTNAYSVGPMELSNALIEFGDNSTWTLI